MKKILATTLSLLALTAAASAEENHIRHVPCTPYNRAEITGVVGQATTFTFPPGLGIYRVVQGTQTPGGNEEAAWAGYDPKEIGEHLLGQNLPLIPLRTGRTYMTLITSTDQTGTNQSFCAVVLTALSSDHADEVGTVYNVIFDGKYVPAAAPRYQVAQTPAAKAWIANKKKKEEEEKEDTAQALVAAYNSDTCQFTAKGKASAKALMPLCPLSNGQWTLFRFPGLTRKPPIYINGRLPRQHESGDYVVVEETAPTFSILLDNEILEIINNNYDPVGPKNPDGVATVNRSVIQAGK